jgi:carbon-monoxide dehydrogenase medium subunit
MPVEAFAYPTSVKEAVALLADPERRAIPIGGGTAVSQGGRRGASLLVDITRCGLDRIETSAETIHLGAGVRVADLASAELPGAAGALLSETARGIATQPLRNAITLGGNVVHLASWADFPVALLALNASVHVSHQQRADFDMSIGELVAEHPHRALPVGSLLVGFTVPVMGGSCGADYRRFRTTITDYSLVTVAALIALEGKRCSHAALAIGAVGPRPVRVPRAEKALVGSTLTRRTLVKAASLAVEETHIVPNYRMAPEVRARILAVEVRRAIEAATKRARAAS